MIVPKKKSFNWTSYKSCNSTPIEMSISDDSQVLTSRWDNLAFHPTPKSICGVGSVHYRSTYFTFDMLYKNMCCSRITWWMLIINFSIESKWQLNGSRIRCLWANWGARIFNKHFCFKSYMAWVDNGDGGVVRWVIFKTTSKRKEKEKGKVKVKWFVADVQVSMWMWAPFTLCWPSQLQKKKKKKKYYNTTSSS